MIANETTLQNDTEINNLSSFQLLFMRYSYTRLKVYSFSYLYNQSKVQIYIVRNIADAVNGL